MTPSDDGLFTMLNRHGVSRRAFLRFCAAMTATLALPAAYTPRVSAAVGSAARLPVVWLRGQGCGGDGDALLRAARPTVTELFLELVSVDYDEAMMASAGTTAELALTSTMEAFPNGYLAVVEGAVPTGDDGIFGLSGGRPFRDTVREVCAGARATIAVGSCAFDGGLAAASGGRTGAAGVGSVVGTDRLVNLPGCPANAENLTATIVHYLTFNELPPRDLRGRPLFAYGGLIHNQCERRSHFEFGEFVLAWGDEAAQKGWCLYKVGCKGPETFANCPTVRYADGATWPIKAGHGCIGCTMPGFWDAMSPFYGRLPGPVPFAPDVTVDQVGLAAVAGVATLTAAHGVASYARQRILGARERRAALRAATAAPDEPAQAAGPIAGTIERADAPPVPATAVEFEASAVELEASAVELEAFDAPEAEPPAEPAPEPALSPPSGEIQP